MLEDFLPGSDEVTRVYRAGAPVSAPPALEDRILKIARDELGRPVIVQQASVRRRWRRPLALAATLVLGLGLALNLHQEQGRQQSMGFAPALERTAQPALPPQGPQPPPPPAAIPVAPAPASAATAAAPEAKREEPAAALRERRAQRQDNAALGAAAADSFAPEAGAGVPSPAPEEWAGQKTAETPQAWLARIRALRDAGRLEEARHELQAFRQQYPQRQLLPDLQTLEAPEAASPPP